MNIDRIYVNTYRYDYAQLRTCVASIRYWYPLIPIFLIKDYTSGKFDTSILEKNWSVNVFPTRQNSFGWGYGKLEPLFCESSHTFLVLDSDTVLTGPVLEKANYCEAPFLVDDEVQSIKRFNQIYYDLNKIGLIVNDFKYPGYSFNSGQWFGSTGYFTREDFSLVIEWSEPPFSKYPDIIFKGDQSVLNYLMHLKEQRNQLTVLRSKLMIWPFGNNASFIDLEKIKTKDTAYPFIIHWAGMKFKRISNYPRADILKYYLSLYNNKLSTWQKIEEKIYINYLHFEKWFLEKIFFIK
ncbi:MAG: hypothetical protein IPL56_00695 [Saprospiraceae bacterium]|nr:hypothetical protein [Saprospiraceae bacterium]